MVLNRGRPSVALDMQQPEAAKVVLELAKDDADQVCRLLKKQRQSCMVVRTAPLAVAQR